MMIGCCHVVVLISSSVDLTLAHRLRRWASINSTLGLPVFAGHSYHSAAGDTGSVEVKGT